MCHSTGYAGLTRLIWRQLYKHTCTTQLRVALPYFGWQRYDRFATGPSVLIGICTSPPQINTVPWLRSRPLRLSMVGCWIDQFPELSSQAFRVCFDVRGRHHDRLSMKAPVSLFTLACTSVVSSRNKALVVPLPILPINYQFSIIHSASIQ